MRGNIVKGVTALRQLMLILYYQRLNLFSLFYSGRSDHPLLAIYTSRAMSKPLHPQYISYYTLFLMVLQGNFFYCTNLIISSIIISVTFSAVSFSFLVSLYSSNSRGLPYVIIAFSNGFSPPLIPTGITFASEFNAK